MSTGLTDQWNQAKYKINKLILSSRFVKWKPITLVWGSDLSDSSKQQILIMGHTMNRPFHGAICVYIYNYICMWGIILKRLPSPDLTQMQQRLWRLLRGWSSGSQPQMWETCTTILPSTVPGSRTLCATTRKCGFVVI